MDEILESLKVSFVVICSIHHNFFFEISSCGMPFLRIFRPSYLLYFLPQMTNKFINKNDMFLRMKEFKKNCGETKL